MSIPQALSRVVVAHSQLALLQRPRELAGYGRLAALVGATVGAKVSAWYPVIDGRLLTTGYAGEGEIVTRATPSALDRDAYAAGRARSVDAPFSHVTRSWSWVTLQLHTQQLVGGIILAGPFEVPGAEMRKGLDGLAAHVSVLVGLWLELHHAHMRLLTDPLTKVGSRIAVMEAIERALPSRDEWLLVYGDLDGFKAVNDTQGHDAGDRVLVDVARRLRDALRPEDLVGRMGGDEFVIVARSSVAEASALLERLRSAIVGSGVGISLGCAPILDSIDATIRAADAQMYAQKSARRRARLTAR